MLCFVRFRVLQRQQDAQFKPSVLNFYGHGAIVFLNNAADTFHSVAVVVCIFACGRQPVDKTDFSLTAVFHTDSHKLFLAGDGKMDQTFFGVFNLFCALKSIVECIAEENAEVSWLEKAEFFAVGYAGQGDACILAISSR